MTATDGWSRLRGLKAYAFWQADRRLAFATLAATYGPFPEVAGRPTPGAIGRQPLVVAGEEVPVERVERAGTILAVRLAVEVAGRGGSPGRRSPGCARAARPRSDDGRSVVIAVSGRDAGGRCYAPRRAGADRHCLGVPSAGACGWPRQSRAWRPTVAAPWLRKCAAARSPSCRPLS